jgi:hypothetical protein
MADLYSSTLGSNARKAQPSSQFGTRNLQFLILSTANYNLFTDDGEGSFADSNSLYSKLVREIQLVAELYYLGQPTQRHSSNGFVFGIASDTAEWYYNEGVNDYPEQELEGSRHQGINDLVDRLNNFFETNDDNVWNLAPLVDAGFGLMPGESLNYLQN